MKLVPILIIPAWLATAPAQADFALVPSAPPPAAPATPTPANPAPPTAQPAALHPGTPSPQHPLRRRAAASDPHITQTARGFGNQIPLSFAVRQIVPPSIKIHFGHGTNEAALVDWRGGRKWPSVLRDAIHPLGLRLTVHTRHATIFHPRKH